VDSKQEPKGWVFEEELDVEPEDTLESGRPQPEAMSSAERLLCPVCGDTTTPASPDVAYARCSGCGSWLCSASFGGRGGVRGNARPRAFSLPNPLERRELRRHVVDVMRGFFGIRKGRRAALNAFGLDVLELGCGPGFRLQTFEDYGWTAVGTEANPAAFEHARGRSLDARNSWPHQTGFGERGFDLVFSCGNFGHLPELLATVEKVRGVLKPDGLVCVAREPLASEKEPPEGSAPIVYSADALKRLFTDRLFSLVSEEIDDCGGMFWFKATDES
jgi:SAM-dependent methyltransferase